MKEAESGLGDPLQADIDFHCWLLVASGNPFFKTLQGFIETALRVSIRFTNYLKGVRAASHEDHEAIYTAFEMQKPRVAAARSRKLQAEALHLIREHANAQE